MHRNTAALGPKLNSLLLDNDLILTANQRQQRYLGALALPAENSVGEQPSIYTQTNWLSNLWLDLQNRAFLDTDKQLLTSAESQLIWKHLLTSGQIQRTIRTNRFGNASELELNDTLIASGSLAKTLQEAHDSLQNWQLNAEVLLPFDNEETTLLRAALFCFDSYLNSHRLATEFDALKAIQRAFSEKAIAKPNRVALYGFAEQTPRWQAFWQESEIVVAECASLAVEALSTPAELQFERFSTIEDEILAAAHWCRELLDNHGDSNPSIAIVVPNLHKNIATVERAFIEVFDPQFTSTPDADTACIPCDISAASSLAEEPVVAAALEVLHLNQFDWPRERVIALNNNPFWGSDNNPVRLSCAQWCKQSPSYDLAIQDYIDTLLRTESEFASTNTTASTLEVSDKLAPPTTCSAHLLSLRTLLRLTTVEQTYTAWQPTLIKALQAIGWPGPRELNSREFQAAQRFIDLINNLGRFDSLLNDGDESGDKKQKPKKSFSQLRELLNTLCSTHQFHVQTTPKPIQILGLMEGAGISFDYCRIVQLNADTLPAQPQPNSLIPYSLQKHHGLPRATPERELLYAKELLASYRSNNPSLTLTFASQNDDEHCNPSPLLLDLGMNLEMNSNNCVSVDAVAPTALTSYYKQQLNYNDYDTIDTTWAPPLATANDAVHGAYHLKLFNGNPFYAFVSYRLGIDQPVEPQFGFDAAMRGNFMHDALARFWRRQESLAQLQSLSASDLNALIHDCCSSALEATLQRSSNTFHRDYLTVEQQRMEEKLGSALALELTRDAFTVVGIETRATVNIDGYNLHLRIDRIDRTVNDELILIDYKSGAVNLQHIQRHPLPDPQLPLYSQLDLSTLDHFSTGFRSAPTKQIDTTSAASVNAIAWFRISADKTEIKGIGEIQQSFKGIISPAATKTPAFTDGWGEALKWWHQSLGWSIARLTEGYVADVVFTPDNIKYNQYLVPLSRNNAKEQSSQCVADDDIVDAQTPEAQQ